MLAVCFIRNNTLSDFQVTDKTLLSSVDRAADSFLIYDADAQALKRTTVNLANDLTSHPVGINDIQTLTNKTITAPTISGPVLSGTVTGTYTLGGTPTFPSAVVTLTGSQTLTNKVLTAPTVNTATINNPTLNTDTVNEFTSANGVTIDGLNIKDSKLNTNNSVVTSNITDSAVTGAKIASYRSLLQAITTNSTETALVAQEGWGFITGDGTNFVNKTVTFPAPFSSVKNVVVGALGLLSGSDPTAITSFNAGFSGNNVMLHAYNITTTGFVLRGTLDSSATLASSIRVGFTWIAKGT